MDELQSVLETYGHTEGSLITILQKTQDIYGYLPMDAIHAIADYTGIKPAKIYGVVTFYAQFRLSPVGKYEVLVCQGTACHVNGSVAIQEAVLEELGVQNGGTTPDNLFTVNSVACLGCCSLSPVMMINGEAYGSLTPDSAKGIIRGLREAAV
jgi:NADH-quinone oxidoreductase subunit E